MNSTPPANEEGEGATTRTDAHGESGESGDKRPSTGRGAGAWPRRAVLFALLALLLWAKLVHDPAPVGHFRADSTFYYLLARSVAEGEGLRTPVSLYHQGLRDLPARTTIYPVWPLVLGGVGRVIGLERAATLVPETLYFASLILLYGVARRLARDPPALVSIRGVPVLDVGHVAVLVLGINRVYFEVTSTCMTEGLAFTLMFASLLLLSTATRSRRPVLPAAVAGGLACLAFLARSQLLLLPVALVAALALVGIGERRFRAAAGAAAGTAALVFLPWLVFLLRLPGAFHPRILLDFTAYRETPELAEFRGFHEFDSVAARLADVAGGLRVALDPTAPFAYVRSFGAPVLLVVVATLAAVPLVVARIRRRAHVQPEACLRFAVCFAAIGCLLPAHALHANYPLEWSFHHRHGLPLILAIVAAVHWCAGRGGIARGFATVAALAVLVDWDPNRGLANEWRFAPALLRFEGRDASMWPAERQLVRWLNEHDEPPVIVSTKSRELALWSQARGHWIRDDLPSRETRLLLRHLDVDYLILYGDEASKRFCRGLMNDLELVQRFTKGRYLVEVFAWKR